MYRTQGAVAPATGPQKPEYGFTPNHTYRNPLIQRRTFLLSNEAAASLPQQAQLALHQVDNRKCHPRLLGVAWRQTCFGCQQYPHSFFQQPRTDGHAVKYFLISAPVDWVPDQYIRRFLLPTGEYVSCVLW